MSFTNVLVLINVLIFIIAFPNLEFFIKLFGFQPQLFIAGEYYRIFTSLFLHGNIFHLILNMLALFVVGNAIEKRIRFLPFILIYFISGFIANLSFFIPIFGYSPETITIGASGAISGLIGFGTFFIPAKFILVPNIIPFPTPFILVGAIYFLATALMLFAISPIAYPAHMFGFLAGSAFGLFAVKKKWQKIKAFLILLLILIAILIFITLIK